MLFYLETRWMQKVKLVWQQVPEGHEESCRNPVPSWSGHGFLSCSVQCSGAAVFLIFIISSLAYAERKRGKHEQNRCAEVRITRVVLCGTFLRYTPLFSWGGWREALLNRLQLELVKQLRPMDMHHSAFYNITAEGEPSFQHQQHAELRSGE